MHDNLITLTQKTAYYFDVEGFVPGADISFHIVFDMQYCAVRGHDADIICCARIVELGLTHIAGKSMHDFDRTGVVNTEIASGVG